MEPGRMLLLSDGRRLGYAEYGDPQGKPLFSFHGTPGSRVGARLAHDGAMRQGIRVIALERPGYGLSDFKRARTLLDWPDDVLQVADALSIERFGIVGVSGGGPYAAACAHKIPQRLTAVGIVSGVGPMDAPGAKQRMYRQDRLILLLGRYLPWLMRVPIWAMTLLARRDPERALRWLMRRMPAPDRAILSRPAVWQAFKAEALEALRRGSGGVASDMFLYSRPWGFRLEDIQIEVHLWHGEADTSVPASMGRYQAKAIPLCRARFYPAEGHLISVEHTDDMLRALVP